MKIIVCPDSFKGTMTAAEAAAVIAGRIKAACPRAKIATMPLGDGGEGTMDAIAASIPGMRKIECPTLDPLHRRISASYYLDERHTAYIESASAGGLTLIAPSERNIMKADTFGTGLLMADAWRRGAREFVVGMGGTATCDGGYGAWRALREAGMPRDIPITLLCDVDNPLCGPNGAAAVFGPQKGATPETIPVLDSLLRQRAEKYHDEGGIEVLEREYAGAAGGLAGMFMACFGAQPVAGIAKVLEIIDFPSQLNGAALVITGEGKADATTLRGKAPAGVLRVAARMNVPVVLVAGRVEEREKLLCAGFAGVETLEGWDVENCISKYIKV